MRRSVAVLVLLVLGGFAAAQSRVSAAPGMRCTLTGKKITTCCCEQKDGKLYCPLAKKAIEKCCCESK
jgi:hypothetical protein